MRKKPHYPPGNPMSKPEFDLHIYGFVPATKLEAWKEGGCEVRE